MAIPNSADIAALSRKSLETDQYSRGAHAKSAWSTLSRRPRVPRNRLAALAASSASSLPSSWVCLSLGSLARGPTTSASDSPNVGAEIDKTAAAMNSVAVVDTPAKPGDSPWVYSTTQDKVRGSTTYFARATSTNTVHQNPLYDADTSMSMTVRKSKAGGTDVYLTISSGQMMCPSYEGCSGTVSFDGAAAQRVRFMGPADSSSETIFVGGAKAFIGKLKRAKKIVIEKTLYEAGDPQFEFDVHGLKWEH